jgi:hypothetical protein
MGFPLKVFSIKRNLVFMNNLYCKVAAASVGIALGFTLGVNKEAKAATFILANPEVFFLEGSADGWERNSLWGSTDDISRLDPYSVRKLYADYERRAFYEFDIGNLSLAPNTVIRRAILKTPLRKIWHKDEPNSPDDDYLFLRLFGYVGNGRADLSDFVAGVSIDVRELISPSLDPRIPRDSIDFDVTPFVNKRVNSSDDFAGFSFGIEGYIVINSEATLRDDYNAPPSLIIETADATVPEPTTIFGSAIGLCLGGWLKRKKSNQQKKTIPQH